MTDELEIALRAILAESTKPTPSWWDVFTANCSREITLDKITEIAKQALKDESRRAQ